MASISHGSSLASRSLHRHADINNDVCGDNGGGGLEEKMKMGKAARGWGGGVGGGGQQIENET